MDLLARTDRLMTYDNIMDIIREEAPVLQAKNSAGMCRCNSKQSEIYVNEQK